MKWRRYKFFSLLGDDGVRLEMQLIRTDNENTPAPEKPPESTNQEESMYNTNWVHGKISGGV